MNAKTNLISRPTYCTDEHLEYLDDLRESGETNMHGACAYLIADFPELAENRGKLAGGVLQYWMRTFGDKER